MKRPVKVEGSERPASAAEDTEFQGLYPSLWDQLSALAYDDGTPRQTASLTIFVEDGQVKLCLGDREEGRTGWCSGRSLSEALGRLDEALRCDRIDWRKSRERPGAAGKGGGRR